MTQTIQVRQKGILTLPVELRRRYHIDNGDVFTLVELGNGALMLIPIVSEVARLGDQAATALAESGTTIDDLLQALEEERRSYYHTHYAGQA
jgi:bifunctional DNA-binding transcriptional regulator/antitoxin component of YhaV-PrlF toxin-antitoxin module